MNRNITWTWLLVFLELESGVHADLAFICSRSWPIALKITGGLHVKTDINEKIFVVLEGEAGRPLVPCGDAMPRERLHAAVLICDIGIVVDG